MGLSLIFFFFFEKCITQVDEFTQEIKNKCLQILLQTREVKALPLLAKSRLFYASKRKQNKRIDRLQLLFIHFKHQFFFLFLNANMFIPHFFFFLVCSVQIHTSFYITHVYISVFTQCDSVCVEQNSENWNIINISMHFGSFSLYV